MQLCNWSFYRLCDDDDDADVSCIIIDSCTSHLLPDRPKGRACLSDHSWENLCTHALAENVCRDFPVDDGDQSVGCL